MGEGAWDAYIEAFHRDRPGITEELLARGRAGSQTAYDWLADALGTVDAVVLDVACGSGALRARLTTNRWVGLDASEAELRRAAASGARPLVRARADLAPVASASAGAVVCSMALMILQPVEAVMAEVGRVLRPGGTFVALVPSTGPLTVADRLRYARLLLALRRRRFESPNDGLLRHPQRLLSLGDLRLVDDTRRRFVCAITDSSVAMACVRALYLPGEAPRRIASAEDVARRWVGSQLGLPLRRIVAVKARSAREGS